MAVKTNLVDEMRTKLQARMDELQPLIDEHNQIGKLLNSLNTPSSAPAKRRGTTASASRAGHGERSMQLLDVIGRHPEGITITNAAKEPEFQGVHQNYLYRLAKTATEKGQVRKDGSKYIFVSLDPTEKQPVSL